MTPKVLTRTVALVLVPCLLANPSMATAFQNSLSQSITVGVGKLFLAFQNQALAPSEYSNHPSLEPAVSIQVDKLIGVEIGLPNLPPARVSARVRLEEARTD